MQKKGRASTIADAGAAVSVDSCGGAGARGKAGVPGEPLCRWVSVEGSVRVAPLPRLIDIGDRRRSGGGPHQGFRPQVSLGQGPVRRVPERGHGGIYRPCRACHAKLCARDAEAVYAHALLAGKLCLARPARVLDDCAHAHPGRRTLATRSMGPTSPP